MIIKNNDKKSKLPDFMIVGAARSGTSSLYFYLRDHPEIFMPEFKEPHFFSFLGKPSPHPDLPPWTLDNYEKLFEKAKNHQAIGEASISYLYLFEESIGSIDKIYQEQAKKIKIIALLRNPVDRAWSYYSLRRRGGYEKSFLEMVDELKEKKSEKDFHNFVLSGMYSKQIEAYLDSFPNVKLFLFDELKENPAELVHDVLEFLKVDSNYTPPNINKVYNISGEPRSAFWKPLYNVLFHKSNVKEIVKPFIPYKLRQKIKTDVGRKIIKKEKMPKDVKQYMSELFEADVHRLLQYFPKNSQRTIIENWIS